MWNLEWVSTVTAIVLNFCISWLFFFFKAGVHGAQVSWEVITGVLRTEGSVVQEIREAPPGYFL